MRQRMTEDWVFIPEKRQLLPDWAPALGTRRESQLTCGHPDCRYYTPTTDSCDYLLLEGHRRGCPATRDCRYYEAGSEEQRQKILRDFFTGGR